MKENKVISVIVPVYNVSKKDLKNCIDSVLRQIYSDLEIILVDDGSFKDIAKFCDSLKKIDSRIKVFHKKNGGVSSARNYGISKSSGRFLSFIDSDDILEEDMYKILINNILEFNADISCCGYSYMELDGKEYKIYGTNKKFHYNSREALISFFNDDSFGVAVWNKLFDAKIIKDLWFDESLKINEDRLFLYNSLTRANSIVYEDKCLYKYIKRKNSATTIKFNENRFDVLKVNSLIEKDLVTNSNNDLVNLWNKNKTIYLIRLYRELILSRVENKFSEKKLEIIDELKKCYSKDLLKKLNKFDYIELIMIVRINFFYPLFIYILIKLKFLKKLKNIIVRKSR